MNFKDIKLEDNPFLDSLKITEELAAYIDDVVEIENASFAEPWSKDAYLGEFTTNEMAHYVGIIHNEKLIAYAGFWHIVDEGHISNIAVAEAYRGKKVGHVLMEALIGKALSLGIVAMTLEVRVSNAPAIHLYEKMGFQGAGKRKGFYQDNNEDALIMWLKF